ncbi:MAG TPA: NAD-dependent epimerase/dehydratase family protein [Methylomirabilota bacterium]|nr:NAD-dependent epimerase/dehydratase family protein [Methylomirabilota bacterium]
MKILVTGGAGFIASHVVDRYLALGHEVVAVDNLATGSRAQVNPRARFVNVDVRSPRLGECFAEERPDVVNHHAAQAAVRRSVADPQFDALVNVVGTVNLLECCRRFGVRRVIFASSGGAVYGDADVLPTPETYPARPASPYGITKLTVEHYLACWQMLYQISWIALRYANVYGPRQNPLGEAGVIAIFSHRLLKGEPPIVNGDGEQTRDYVYVGDVVEANACALERQEVNGPVNVGTGTETSVNGLLKELSRWVDHPVKAVHGPAKAGEQLRSVVDPSRAKTLLGWSPQVTLEEGLRRTVDYFSKEVKR